MHAGDRVTFRFKQHHYSAAIAPGGLLTACQMDRKGMDGVYNDLQTWCDDCIYDHGGDYVARFSSTKRVKHAPTGRSMALLKQELHTKGQRGATCMCAESTAQQRRVLELEQQVRQLQQELHGQKHAEPCDSDEDNPFVLKF